MVTKTKKQNIRSSRSSPPEVFLEKCSENVQQIYRIALIPKCGFRKVA